MNELWGMGGYELYVWGSVGLALLVFAWNWLAPRLQRNSVLRRVAETDAEDAP